MADSDWLLFGVVLAGAFAAIYVITGLTPIDLLGMLLADVLGEIWSGFTSWLEGLLSPF